ncbi:MAG: glycosyltransferase family A protein [Flavobacteriales bacterium]|nr:glycosyltransferase family A protein [Flavobacteriales bacterium]
MVNAVKFSIILPTFNRGYMIHHAIESVLNQTYKDWELIIVDDGSTDDTKDVIAEFIEKDNRIRYLHQKNKERSAARNKGIKEAKGHWICFLDSDDIYHTNHLEEFKNLINQNDLKRGIYFSGLSYDKYSEDFEEYDLTHKNNIEFIFLNTIGTPRACIHKSILLKHQFNEKIRIGEDRELWVRILKKNPLYFHRKKTFIEVEHPNRSINLGAELENLKTLNLILKSNKKSIRKKVKNKVLSNAYFKISKSKIKANKIIIAGYYIVLSLIYCLKHEQTKHKLMLLIAIYTAPNSNFVKVYK